MDAESHGEPQLLFHHQGTKGTKKEAGRESNSKKFLNLLVSGFWSLVSGFWSLVSSFESLVSSL